ncbi:alpha/beta hydrolase [Halorhodospira halochloris]|uniref:alpha/beta hydrolase n=1 Tax=Halorhodospira halochloris TaxID=1052 RepID=UPI001EE80F24|nr:alpha/beta hydrolase [Halorhodospira halochloris]MCG5548879.1 carboxylesterase [Halorhodospira halochloris]
MATTPSLEYIEKTTKQSVDASVIWLHGLGADGSDFVPIVDELPLGGSLGVRFIFPHAPVRQVTVNGGMPMRAWYDIIGLGEGGIEEDTSGLAEALSHIVELIGGEKERGIPAERIVLAGFSQGAATALYAGLQLEQAPAGIIALSGWLPAATEIKPLSGLDDLPIFMAHGNQDPVVPLRLGLDSSRRLTDAGFRVDWHEYTLEHGVCMAEIEQVGKWLKSLLG